MLYEVPNMSNGLDNTMIGISGSVKQFVPMLLLFIFMIIFLGGSSAQRKRTGYSDYSMWAVLSMIAVMMISLAMSLVSGFITTTTLIVIVILTLLTGLWFFFSRRQIED